MILKALKITPFLLGGFTAQPKLATQNNTQNINIGYTDTLYITDRYNLDNYQININVNEEQTITTTTGTIETASITIQNLNQVQTPITQTVTNFGTRTINTVSYNINPFSITMLKITNQNYTSNTFNMELQNVARWPLIAQLTPSQKYWKWTTNLYTIEQNNFIDDYYASITDYNQPYNDKWVDVNPYQSRNILLQTLTPNKQDSKETQNLPILNTNINTQVFNNKYAEYINKVTYVIIYTEINYTGNTYTYNIPSGQDHTFDWTYTFFGESSIKLDTETTVIEDTSYEVVNVPEVMFNILTMPFTFISTAFNLVLFPGTPYQVNVSNIFLFIISILVFAIIIKIIMRFMK